MILIIVAFVLVIEHDKHYEEQYRAYLILDIKQILTDYRDLAEIVFSQSVF